MSGGVKRIFETSEGRPLAVTRRICKCIARSTGERLQAMRKEEEVSDGGVSCLEKGQRRTYNVFRLPPILKGKKFPLNYI